MKGEPVALQRWLEANPISPLDLTPTPRSIALADVVRWEEFGQANPLQWPRQARGHLIGWERGRDGQYQGVSIHCQPLAELVDHDIVRDWSCDIADVQGLAACKAPLEELASLDALALATRPSLVDDVSPAGLARNLAHDEIRILHRPAGSSDFFVRRAWDGRLFLANAGGGHHFAAAHYLAKRLGQAEPLVGKLHRYALNPAAVAKLTSAFELFALEEGDASLWNALHDAFRSDHVDWYWCSLPHPFREARALFLPRSRPRARRAAEALRAARAADLGQTLRSLVGRPAS